MTRAECLASDAADPLASLRDLFVLDRVDADGVIYLDGNSLGPLPRSTAARVAQVVEHEWGIGLVRSWNDAGWMHLSARVADRIAGLIGAHSGEVVVADSTSINLFKVLSAAIDIVKASSPRRRRIVAERHDFPSDLYIADTLARAHGFELALTDAEDLARHLDDRLGILLLSHVSYRTGRMHPSREVTQAAHRAGGLMVWDLSHSTGAVPVDLHGGGAAGAAADFAVGCGYKFLNGGPGAPAGRMAWARRALRVFA
jgi:kynureninase